MNDVMNSLISVIIPVYNGERYIKRCLESVIKQTYINLEIIIVNDGSTDGSLAICQKYQEQDRRIRIINQNNGGLSKARNAGLMKAQGEYIGFVDCDDWLQPDMYEYLLKIITDYQVEVAVCDFVRVKKKKKLRQPQEKVVVKSQKELFEEFYRIYGGKSFFSVWNRLYHRDSVNDIFFLENEINEDVYYTYQVYKKVCKVAVSNQVKYSYFINQTGITVSRLSRKDYSQFRIWDKIVENERGTEYYAFAVLNRKRAVFNLYMKGRLSGCSDDLDVGIMEEWRKQLRRDYKILMSGHMLDKKRKFILTMICKFYF